MNVKPTPSQPREAKVCIPIAASETTFVLALARVTVIDFYPARTYQSKEKSNGT